MQTDAIFIFQNDATELKSLNWHGQGGCVYAGVAESEDFLAQHLVEKWSWLTGRDGSIADHSAWSCLGSRRVPSHLSALIMNKFRCEAMAKPVIALDLLSTLRTACYSPKIHVDFGDSLEEDIHKLCCLTSDNMRQLVTSTFAPASGRSLAGPQLMQLMLKTVLDGVIYEHVGDDDPALT